jgi:hypothetical protein
LRHAITPAHDEAAVFGGPFDKGDLDHRRYFACESDFCKRRHFKPITLSWNVNPVNESALMKYVLRVLLVLFLAATGCRTPAQKLEPSFISQIQEGTTTRAELEQIFGQPKRVFKGSNQKTLTLHKYQINRHNPGWRGFAEQEAGSIVLRGLTVLYGTNQVVEKYLFDQSSTIVHRDGDGIVIGWSPAKADFTKIVKGITSHGELIQWYGAPTMRTLTIDGERELLWSFLRTTTRFQSDEREQEFHVILDNDDFVKDFGLFGKNDTFN